MADDQTPVAGGREPPTARVAPSEGYEDEISVLELLSLFLRHRYRIAGWALLLGALALGFSLLRPAQYAASGSFVPQGSQADAGRLSSLAGQFGVSVPGGGDGAEESPAFYAELLRSRAILRDVATDRYEVGEGTAATNGNPPRRGTLPEILQIEDDSPELEIARAITWLRNDAVQVQTDVETGLVTLTVTTRRPELSYEIASRLVTLVNQFNLETRQSRAATEREFIEGRLAEANDSLLAAENRLEGFLQANRQFQNSPELVFQHDRLQRQVARAQEIVTSLSQSYEEARVSEVRNTPVITVVESPDVPLRAESRNLLLMTLLGLLLGGMLGVFHAFGRELVWRERERGSETYEEFSNLWQKTWGDIRTLGGRLS